MRIVYLLTSLGIGGAERQSVALAECMRERGHSVALITLLPRLEEEWPTSLPVFRLGMHKDPLSISAALIHARRYLRDLQPEIVHSHSFHANIFARLLKILVSAPAVVSTVHNVNEGGSLRMLAYRLTDPLSCRTTAVSDAVADRFIRLRTVPARKCTVILNGIDIAEFSPDATRRVEARTAFQANSDFIWLAAGRFAPSKDYPNLLQAFAQLRASHLQTQFDTQLWIAGQGATAETAALRSLAVQLGIGDSIRWLGLRRDLPALLDAADAFVLSSAWEGLPLVVAEAMAMEKPVIATDVGGVGELVADCGTTVPPRNHGALAHAMLTLMRQTEEARYAQGRHARERIVEYFSMDSRADRWESFYKSLFDSANSTNFTVRRSAARPKSKG